MSVLARWMPTVVVILFWLAVLGVMQIWKKKFFRKASKWPSVPARIENVFVEGSDPGLRGRNVPHLVLAYSYSVGGSFYSGQIRLEVWEGDLDDITKSVVGKQISVQYDPRKPGDSVFLKHKVRGRYVVPDQRTSVSALFD